MPDAYLSRLLRYAPRLGRTTKEDFLTEAFAGLLTLDPELVMCVFGPKECARIGGRVGELDLPTTTTSMLIETQFGLDGGRPDLVFSWDKQVRLIVENKIDAGFTYRANEIDVAPDTDKAWLHQLQGYVDGVEKKGWTAKVLLVSKWPRNDVPEVVRKKSGVYAGNMLWHEIYTALSRVERRSDERPRVLLKEFLELLKALAMEPPTPIRFGDGKIIHNHTDLLGRMRMLLDQVVHDLSRRFGIDSKTRRDSCDYTNWKVRSGNLVLDVGLLAAARGEANAPIRPILHVNLKSPREIIDAVVTKTKLAWGPSGAEYWNGKTVYPTDEEMRRFLEASDWETQGRELDRIITGWFGKLAEAGLVDRKNP